MALQGKHKTLAQTISVVIVMGALAWASVPFYDWFCRVTGFGGTPGTAIAGSDQILDRTVKVRFDASQARGFGWEFKPLQKEMELRIGETGLAFYEAYNPSKRAIAGQASYNVTPMRQVISSTRSNASALPNRSCSPASVWKCPSVSMLIPKWLMIAMQNTFTPSR